MLHHDDLRAAHAAARDAIRAYDTARALLALEWAETIRRAGQDGQPPPARPVQFRAPQP